MVQGSYHLLQWKCLIEGILHNFLCSLQNQQWEFVWLHVCILIHLSICIQMNLIFFTLIYCSTCKLEYIEMYAAKQALVLEFLRIRRINLLWTNVFFINGKSVLATLCSFFLSFFYLTGYQLHPTITNHPSHWRWSEKYNNYKGYCAVLVPLSMGLWRRGLLFRGN